MRWGNKNTCSFKNIKLCHLTHSSLLCYKLYLINGISDRAACYFHLADQKGQLRISLLLISVWLGTLVWLVVSLTSPRWPADLCPESSTGEQKVRQVWCFFSRVPSLVPSAHKRPSVFQSRPRSPGSGPVTQENLRYSVQVLRDQESSRNENRWLECFICFKI